ncbi:MAG: RsmD family RNA methyltransferase [Pirellulales bacterium]
MNDYVDDDDFEDDVEDVKPVSKRPKAPKKIKPTQLRIVAGELRSRRIVYNGDPATRPMKEKTREAVFSVLGGYLEDTYAIDLFGGTGILAFEAVSRGSSAATILELSRATVNSILDNMRTLKLDNLIEVQNVDTLRWLRTADHQTARMPKCPWVIFCCPPYAMWNDQGDRLVEGLKILMEAAPAGSRIVGETEENYDLASQLPGYDWDVRRYKPALVAFGTKS